MVAVAGGRAGAFFLVFCRGTRTVLKREYAAFKLLVSLTVKITLHFRIEIRVMNT